MLDDDNDLLDYDDDDDVDFDEPIMKKASSKYVYKCPYCGTVGYFDVKLGNKCSGCNANVNEENIMSIDEYLSKSKKYNDNEAFEENIANEPASNNVEKKKPLSKKKKTIIIALAAILGLVIISIPGRIVQGIKNGQFVNVESEYMKNASSYIALGYIQIGISPSDISNNLYEYHDLVQQLTDKGFTNIMSTYSYSNFGLNSLVKDYYVIDMTINGKSEWESYEYFSPDAHIYITYHRDILT